MAKKLRKLEDVIDTKKSLEKLKEVKDDINDISSTLSELPQYLENLNIFFKKNNTALKKNTDNTIKLNNETKKTREESQENLLIDQEDLNINEDILKNKKEELRLKYEGLQVSRKEALENEKNKEKNEALFDSGRNFISLSQKNLMDPLEFVIGMKEFEDGIVDLDKALKISREGIESYVSTMDGITIFYNEDDLKSYEDELKKLREIELKDLSEHQKELKEIKYREEDDMIVLAKKYREDMRTLMQDYYEDKEKPTLMNGLKQIIGTPKDALEHTPAFYMKQKQKDIADIKFWYKTKVNWRKNDSEREREEVNKNWDNPYELGEVSIVGKAPKKKQDIAPIDRKAQQENNIDPLPVPNLEAVQSAVTEIKEQYKGLEQATSETVEKQGLDWDTLASKTQEYAGYVTEGVTAIFSATNAILQDQLDEANEQFNKISEQYDEVVEKRKESDDKIKELQDRALHASGEKAATIQAQLEHEMEANQKLANQETDLAKKKEKAEKEIVKKEKEMKKANLAQNIIEGTSNVAVAVTKALASGPIIGKILAAITAASGAIQVGILTKQYNKLEQGGLLHGKRHSQGGMRVEGTNIEVEGGEYVVNRESTGKNMGLLSYINRQRRELKANDLHSYFAQPTARVEVPLSRKFESGGYVAPNIDEKGGIDSDELIDAIRSMKIQPRVAVTDILRVQDEMVSVDGWSGM